MQKRCSWCINDPLYFDYHDHEWGVPLHDNQKLFEMLILEGMQAGLNWLIILKKRENFREAFDQFNPDKIVHFDEKKIKSLLLNPNIIRNRLKIEAAIQNAKAYLNIQETSKDFDSFIWQFTEGKPIQAARKSAQYVPTSTSISDQMSKVLKQHGFRFVGTTICYAFMQAVGIVNDHTIDCFRYSQLQNLK